MHYKSLVLNAPFQLCYGHQEESAVRSRVHYLVMAVVKVATAFELKTLRKRETCTSARFVRAWAYLGAEAKQIQRLHWLGDGLVEGFISHHPPMLPHAEAVLLVRDVVVHSPPVHELRRQDADSNVVNQIPPPNSIISVSYTHLTLPTKA